MTPFGSRPSWPASISARASDSRVHSRSLGFRLIAVSATRARRSEVRCRGSAAFMYWTFDSRYAARLSRFATAIPWPFVLTSVPLPVEAEPPRLGLPRVPLDQLRRDVELGEDGPVVHRPAGLRLPCRGEPIADDLRRLRH